MNDKRHSPSLDFAGWFGSVTPGVVAAYAILSVLLLAGAHLFHRSELARRS